MTEYKVDPDQLAVFFETLDNFALYRFAARFAELDHVDRTEVLRLFELAYTCAFADYPDAGGVQISFDNNITDQMELLAKDHGC